MSSVYDPNYVDEPVYIRLGIKTVVTGADGKILLVRRSDKVSNPHDWGFPGGGVDKDEDPAVAAIREVQEEAGLAVRSPKPFGSYVYAGEGVTIIGYSAIADSSEVTLNWESEDYRWVTREELESFDLPGMHAQLRDQFLHS